MDETLDGGKGRGGGAEGWTEIKDASTFPILYLIMYSAGRDSNGLSKKEAIEALRVGKVARVEAVAAKSTPIEPAVTSPMDTDAGPMPRAVARACFVSPLNWTTQDPLLMKDPSKLGKKRCP